MENFWESPRWTKENGEARRVGFELEFSHLSIDRCAEVVQQELGGSVNTAHTFLLHIMDSKIGPLKVELDSTILLALSSMVENSTKEGQPIAQFSSWLRAATRLTGDVSRLLVPVEIATSPLQFEEFSVLEDLKRALRQAGAHGTQRSFLNAFGLHLNPELPSHDIDTILNYLRAFLILYPWLKHSLNVDLARRLLTYINPFPATYVRKVLNESYQPTLAEFTEDYLTHNPTRNRALDLLPLLTYLDDSVKERLSTKEQGLLKPRPTLHYRLPNCSIDEENWTIAREWNHWVIVERLASDPATLTTYLPRCIELLDINPLQREAAWVEEIQKLLDL